MSTEHRSRRQQALAGKLALKLKIYILLHRIEIRWLHYKLRPIVSDALIQTLL